MQEHTETFIFHNFLGPSFIHTFIQSFAYIFHHSIKHSFKHSLIIKLRKIKGLK